jgi:hypothetical protein
MRSEVLYVNSNKPLRLSESCASTTRDANRAQCFEPAQRNNRAGSEQSDGMPPSELVPVHVTVHQGAPQKNVSRQESQPAARRLLKQPSLPNAENPLCLLWIADGRSSW